MSFYNPLLIKPLLGYNVFVLHYYINSMEQRYISALSYCEMLSIFTKSLEITYNSYSSQEFCMNI